MPPALDTLFRVLAQEKKIGYADKSMIGGMDKFAEVWDREAASVQARSRALYVEIASALRNYASQTPEEREQSAGRMLALAARLQIHTDVRLREINQGEWQGLRLNEIQARYAELYQQREQDPLEIAPPGGESILQMQQRAFKVLDEILRRHAGETVAIVCHGLTIAVIRVRLDGRSIEEVWGLIPKNGGWVEYEV